MRPDLHTRGHLSDDRLIALLHSAATADEASHLAACAQCRSEFEAYQATLEYVSHWQVPERGPEYGARVWQRVAGEVRPRKRFQWVSAPVALWAGVAACGLVLLLVPMLRHGAQSVAPVSNAEVKAPTPRGRLLNTALRDHLERASILFTHVLNDPGFAAADEDDVENLIAENRLYRQTAEQQNDRDAAVLLSDVETVLLDLQHSSAAPAAELRYVQQRISDSSLRFRLGIARSYQRPPAAAHVRLVGRGL
jgi:hypothetical protein